MNRQLENNLEDLDRNLTVNVRALFVATQAAVKQMQAGILTLPGRLKELS
jgi:NAD(P)-dependent dehydrogenase (short-subunit alcohol dehydrogenase family)